MPVGAGTSSLIHSGTELWRTERLLGVTGGYSTPSVAEVDGEKFLISAAPGEMIAYDPL
jgi:hypothetical protein